MTIGEILLKEFSVNDEEIRDIYIIRNNILNNDTIVPVFRIPEGGSKENICKSDDETHKRPVLLQLSQKKRMCN